jgi:hypothetical protein
VHIVTELTKKNEELQVQADEAVRLKDKVDECVAIFRLLECADTFY